jgi:hypothetical protein
MRSIALAGFALLLLRGPALAQDSLPLPGQTVRVIAGDARLLAQFVGVRGDTLDLAIGGHGVGRAYFPVETIQRLEIRHGNSRGRGALKGMLIGGGIGLALGAFSDPPDRRDGEPMTSGESIAFAAGNGALIGAIWGALRPGSTWTRVSLPGP